MTRKTAFFEGWSWFKFNNLGLALGTNLKFYTSVAKGLKLKVRKFWGLIPMFVEVRGEKLVEGLFAPPLPSWKGLTDKSLKKINRQVNHDLSLIYHWPWTNGINLNASKTEIIVFRPKNKQITKHLNFRICGQKINTCRNVNIFL